MKIAIEEKKLVMGLYCMTLCLSMLAIVDNIPFKGGLRDVKYLYIVIIVFFCIYDGVLILNKRIAIGMGLLVLHTMLYGLVFVNPYIQSHTDTHFKQMMAIYAVTFFTCIYVWKKDCYLLFLEMSYLALAMFICWCALTHLGNFVNPVYFVNIFSRTERFRAAFGMGDVNYCGNYCIYLLVFSFILWCEWKKQEKMPKRWLLWGVVGIDFITLYMLLSTASRSAILSLLLFFLCFGLLKKKKEILENWKFVLTIGGTVVIFALVFLVSSGMMADIWLESNREGNFSINYPIFLEYGNYMNGMGYMDNSGFLGMEYGYATTAMDVYFLYIPFATGIIGATIILLQMLYLLYQLLKNSSTDGRDLALSLFVMMLYYAIWQVNYMNYRYFTGILHMVVLFLFLMRINKENDVYIFKIQRR